MALQYVGPATKYWYAPTTVTTPGVLPSGEATITAWFRLASGYSGNQTVAGWGNGSTTYNGISAYNGNVVIQERNSTGGSGTQTIVANPTDQTWHFVAFQSDVSFIRGGIDGTAPSSGISAAQQVSGASQFNRVFFGGGGGIGFLNGSSTAMQVAEIAVWDNALSSTDITFLAGGGSPKDSAVTSAHLLAYFRLGSDFTDLGPNNYTVSSVGSPVATWVAGPPVANPPSGGTDVTVTPGAGSVVFTGYTPTVTVGTSSTVTPGKGSLGIAGTAPAVSVGVAAGPGVGSVAFAGHAPTITTTTGGSVTVSPGLGRLSIAGHAPAVTQPAEEPRTGGAADRRKKKKRKPVAKVLTSLSELSDALPIAGDPQEPLSITDAVSLATTAPLFSDLLRSLDAKQSAQRDNAAAEAERAAVAQRVSDEDAAKAEERRAAIEATRLAREKEKAETAARQKEAAQRLEAQNKRIAAMQQAFDALVKRHRDQEEEDLEWLLKG